MKYGIAILAALFGLHAGAATAQEQEYSCESEYDGHDIIKDVRHIVTIGTSGGAVTRFEYLSIIPLESTLCAYVADSRATADSDEAKALLPVWSRTAAGARISIPARIGENAVIDLQDKGAYFHFEIVQTGSDEEFCNLYGVAAPVVRIYKKNKTCGFPKR